MSELIAQRGEQNQFNRLTQIIMLTRLLILSALSVTAFASYAASAKSIKCGAIVDVESKSLRKNVIVQIEGQRISGVGSNFDSQDDVIDLSDYTCLPGLIDMHVHLMNESNATDYIDMFTKNTAVYAYRAANFAEKTLQAGFTSVRNLGDDGTITVALRDAIAEGIAEGPRIYTAGRAIATTGGHADMTNGYRSDLMGDPGAKDGVINGTAEAAKAVRQRYKEGADLIKITATGGVFSVAKNGQNPQFSDAELAAIISTANDYGFRVAAHAHGTLGMKRAIRAGVSSIEHGTIMDDEARRLMVKHGTYLVPTMMAGAFVVEKAKIDGYFPEIIRPKAAAIGSLVKENMQKAIKAGIKIAYGTDCGVSPHGTNGEEFALLVDAGMTPMDAIVSATKNAADLMGDSENIGSVSVGKYADIVAVKGNPIDDISLLENVNFVMKGGTVYKHIDSSLVDSL